MTRTLVDGLKAPRASALALAAVTAALLFAFLHAGSAAAQTPDDELSVSSIEPGTISVTGTAVAAVESDEAVISLTVSATRDRVIDAVLDANAAMEAVILALLDAGLTTDDLQTTGISLQPQFDFTEAGRVLVGFRFTNSLLVTVGDINAVGEVLDAAIVAGGDLIQLNNVSFQVSNRSEVEDQVRLAAVDDAVAKATAIAERLGLRLGRAISVQEFGFATPVPVGAIAFDEAAGAAPPVFGGTQDIRASVQIVFETWPTT